MADYYPLLARALESLPDNNRATRGVVYDRARAALLAQLKGLNPPLSEEAIAREIGSLDEAVARIEGEQDQKAMPAPAPEVADDKPARPKVDGSQIKRGGRRNRSVMTAIGLVAVIVPIAVLAWLWRDRPVTQSSTTPPTTQPSAPPTASSEPKFPERVGSGSSQERPPASPSRDPAPPAGQTGQPPASSVAVAQKAGLIEENSQDPKQPKMTAGRAIWRLDAVNAGQGQPLDTVVRASVEIPEAGVTLQLALKKNRDSALPASHTMELVFTTPADDPNRAVRDVNPPLFRGDDGARGVPVAALSVPVKENLFLIGLSDLRSDLDRNIDLIRNRNWVEIPLRFASGMRATLVFEKGIAGERVINDALKAWEQPRP